MSSKNGPLVFTATPEMAAQMPKIFRSGVTYVAQQAAAVAIEGATTTRTTRVSKKTKTTKKKASKKASKTTKKKASKKASKKSPAKATRRKSIKPEIVLQYVKDNQGCNMNDIEWHTKMPQAAIRRVLNAAREAGEIRTEGQRRGLRYFSGAEAATAN